MQHFSLDHELLSILVDSFDSKLSKITIMINNNVNLIGVNLEDIHHLIRLPYKEGELVDNHSILSEQDKIYLEMNFQVDFNSREYFLVKNFGF